MEILTTNEIVERMGLRIKMFNGSMASCLKRRSIIMSQADTMKVFGQTPMRDANCKTLESLGPSGRPTMDPHRQRIYLDFLRQIRDIGGNNALWILIDTIYPAAMARIDFKEDVFQSWWRTVKIDEQIERNLDMVITKSQIIEHFKKARVRGLIPMSSFTDRLAVEIAKHNDGQPFLSPSGVFSKTMEHGMTLQNEIREHIDGTTPTGITYCHEVLKHIYRTGGIEAVVLCTTSLDFNSLYSVDYFQDEFEKWWSDNRHAGRHLLTQIREASQKITQTYDDKVFLQFVKISLGK